MRTLGLFGVLGASPCFNGLGSFFPMRDTPHFAQYLFEHYVPRLTPNLTSNQRVRVRVYEAGFMERGWRGDTKREKEKVAKKKGGERGMRVKKGGGEGGGERGKGGKKGKRGTGGGKGREKGRNGNKGPGKEGGTKKGKKGRKRGKRGEGGGGSGSDSSSGGSFGGGGPHLFFFFFFGQGSLCFRDSIATEGIARGTVLPLFHVVSRKHRRDTPLLRGYRTSSAHARRRGIIPNLCTLRHPKPHSSRSGGIAEIVSRYRALRLGEAKPGGFQTRVFPTFFGKGPDCVADPFGTVPRRCS